MIINASQRANAGELARHLLNVLDNDHVEVHSINGFMADNLADALNESATLSKHTQCKKHLFSVSFNPPLNEDVKTKDFADAIARCAQKLGLEQQPHAIVFHEKHGRRHAHAVFCRINLESMKAIHLPFFKNKMAELSKELYLEHNWALPQGHLDKSLRNPVNFSLQEFQQAKRMDVDPKLIKQALQSCWKRSNDRESFEKTIEKHGYYLAQGDRRGFVAVNHDGKVLSLTRWLGVKNKDLKKKLGAYQTLPDIDTAKAKMNKSMVNRVKSFQRDIRQRYKAQKAPLLAAKQQMIAGHRLARDMLKDKLGKRQTYEMRMRQARFSHGLKRVWSRVTGQYRRIERRNEIETFECHQRDQLETDNLILSQLDEQKDIQSSLDKLYAAVQKELANVKEAVFSNQPIDQANIQVSPAQPIAPKPKPSNKPQQQPDFNLGM